MTDRLEAGMSEPKRCFATTCSATSSATRFGCKDISAVSQAIHKFYLEWSVRLPGGLQFTFCEDDNPTPPWEARIDTTVSIINDHQRTDQRGRIACNLTVSAIRNSPLQYQMCQSLDQSACDKFRADSTTSMEVAPDPRSRASLLLCRHINEAIEMQYYSEALLSRRCTAFLYASDSPLHM
eukprot:IDg23768t1